MFSIGKFYYGEFSFSLGELKGSSPALILKDILRKLGQVGVINENGTTVTWVGNGTTTQYWQDILEPLDFLGSGHLESPLNISKAFFGGFCTERFIPTTALPPNQKKNSEVSARWISVSAEAAPLLVTSGRACRKL